jgi:hypothetical protein
MTPNEARQVLLTYREQAKRRDVLGKVARQEMREAYIVLGHFAIEVSQRMTGKRARTRKLAYLEMAGFYRQAAQEIMQ